MDSQMHMDCLMPLTLDMRVTLRSRLDLAPKRLESRLSHHLMTQYDWKFLRLKSATCTMTMIIVYAYSRLLFSLT